MPRAWLYSARVPTFEEQWNSGEETVGTKKVPNGTFTEGLLRAFLGPTDFQQRAHHRLHVERTLCGLSASSPMVFQNIVLGTLSVVRPTVRHQTNMRGYDEGRAVAGTKLTCPTEKLLIVQLVPVPSERPRGRHSSFV